MLLVLSTRQPSLEIGGKNLSKELKLFVEKQIPSYVKTLKSLFFLFIVCLALVLIIREGIVSDFVIYFWDLGAKQSGKYKEKEKIKKIFLQGPDAIKTLYKEITKRDYDEYAASYSTKEKEKTDRIIYSYRIYYRVLDYAFYFLLVATVVTLFASPMVYFFRKYGQGAALIKVQRFIWDIMIRFDQRIRQKYIDILRNLNQTFMSDLGKLFQDKAPENILTQFLIVFSIFFFIVWVLGYLLDKLYEDWIKKGEYEDAMTIMTKTIIKAAAIQQGNNKHKLIRFCLYSQLFVSVLGFVIFVIINKSANKKSLELFNKMIGGTKKIADTVVGIISLGNRDKRIMKEKIEENNQLAQVSSAYADQILNNVMLVAFVLIMIIGISLGILTIVLQRLRAYTRTIDAAIKEPQTFLSGLKENSISMPDSLSSAKQLLDLFAKVLDILKKVIIAVFILLACFMIFLMISILSHLSKQSSENDNRGKIEAHNRSLGEIKKETDALPRRPELLVIPRQNQEGSLSFYDFGIGFPFSFTENSLFAVKKGTVLRSGIYACEGVSGSGKTSFINTLMGNFFGQKGLGLNTSFEPNYLSFTEPGMGNQHRLGTTRRHEPLLFRKPIFNHRYLMYNYGIPLHYNLRGLGKGSNLVIEQQLNIPTIYATAEDFIMAGNKGNAELAKLVMEELEIGHLFGKPVTTRSLGNMERFLIIVAKTWYHLRSQVARQQRIQSFIFLDEMLTGANYEQVEVVLRKLIKDMEAYVKSGGIIFFIDHTQQFVKTLKKSSCKEYTKRIQIDSNKKQLRVLEV